MMAYSTLIEGSPVRDDRPLTWQYDTPDNQRRRQTLWRVADEADVTRTRLAFAHLLRGATGIVPIVGVSSVAQLDDALGALDVPLDAVAALISETA
jgi:aryl-alcohol dehydrogenase-like predicted oxidoreductase